MRCPQHFAEGNAIFPVPLSRATGSGNKKRLFCSHHLISGVNMLSCAPERRFGQFRAWRKPRMRPKRRLIRGVAARRSQRSGIICQTSQKRFRQPGTYPSEASSERSGGERPSCNKGLKAHKKRTHDVASFFVRLSRFELLTSCLSSKRSKPTELKPRMGLQR